MKSPDSGVYRRDQQASISTRGERGQTTHGFRQVEFDFVVEVFEVELSVFHAGQESEDQEVTTLPSEQVLDRRELSPSLSMNVISSAFL